MVAVIKSSASLRNVLHYNENKVEKKVAKLIHEKGFTKDIEQLSIRDKIRTFEKYSSLNERTKLSTVHISLNFHPEEKIDQHTFTQIAETYLQKIGFGAQPFLVYQHFDAGHPHLHIITTNIQMDGTRISMQNIGKNKSEKARKEIEKSFQLRPAERGLKNVKNEVPATFTVKVQYGKSETKRAITNVIDAVVPHYKYASLPELNAVLGLYNVVADKGEHGSRVAKHGGLLYRALDSSGKKTGVPIKASSIYCQPTLSFLEKRFRENGFAKEIFKKELQRKLDWLLRSKHKGIEAFKQSISKEGVELVLRQNDLGIIYGLTYVDMRTKCVFNGSDLGKAYSARAVLQHCGLTPHQSTTTAEIISPEHKQIHVTEEVNTGQEISLHQNEILKALLTPTLSVDLIPSELKKRKKKRGKSPNH